MSVINRLLGQLHWIPPTWFQRLGKIKLIGLLLLFTLVLIGGYSAYTAYQARPIPPHVVGTASPPSLSPIVNERPRPQPLYIDFTVKTDPRTPEQGTVAIARADLVNNTVADGITLTPALRGTWEWLSDTRLRFSPDEDWPAGQTYSVAWKPTIFAPGLRFERSITTFDTAAFAASIDKLEFYQDPIDSSERKVVATVSFTHPVTLDAFNKHVALAMRDDGATINDTPRNLSINSTLDASGRIAYLHSATLEVPAQESFATLTVNRTLTSVNSDQALEEDQLNTVRIPDVSSYFRVESSRFLLARDEDDAPQQTVTLSFTDRVATAALANKLTLYALPSVITVNGRTTSKRWDSPREVTPDILSQSSVIDFVLNPHDTDSASLHSLKLDVPTNRHYYVRVEQGLRSDGKFVLSTPYDAVLYVPDYPKEVRVAQQGAVLPLTGSHKVHFVSRGVTALKVEIGRLLDHTVNHLASQMDGDIANPQFNHYRFNQDNLTTTETRYISLPSAHPKQPSYAHIDLSDRLDQGGFYYVRVSGWDEARDSEVGGADHRLVLITDLGFVAKTGALGEHHLFVHSLASGNPVSGATISLLGKNGLPLFTARTDAQGHAEMPSAREYTRAKTPTVYLVRRGTDAVFMPYGRYTRQLDFSRFDAGGEYSAANDDTLRAQLFTERDLFRPGDVVHLGGIVKRGDWQALARVPLTLDVRDPRGQTVVSKPLKLPSDGFIEYDFQTDLASVTGDYSVSLYTVRNRHQRTYIGGHSFRVQEFQPDRLKIRSTISGQKPKGWIKPERLSVNVQLDNLFGTPAADRRVTGLALLKPARMQFADFADYRFDDPLRREGGPTQTIETTLSATTTDSEGAAQLDLDLSQYDGGIYELSVFTEGFEAGGGRSVKARARMMVSPLDALVGYKASGNLTFIQKEAERLVEFVALDDNGAPLELPSLTARIYETRFVSTLVKQRDGTFAYQSIAQDSLVSEQPFSVSIQGSHASLPTQTAGRFAFELRDATGTVYSRIPFVVAGARNVAGNLEQSAELDLSLDKGSYAPGDDIAVHITAPYLGAGLITIERDSVLAFKWFNASTTNTVQSIRVPNNIEGNAYVNVTFMRSLDSEEIYLNPLSYALAPFSINRDARTVNITLDAPDKVIPGETLTIDYATNQAARIALFAVDQGILQVANYQRPKPLDFFLQKRALRVATYQLADLVLPEFLSASVSAAPGGGEAAGLAGRNLNPFQRKTDAPVVYWSGIIEASPQSRSVSYDVPDYFNGQLSIMAVAVADNAVGDAATITTVRGPFVISPNAPVTVAPGDEFEVSVGLANNVENSGTGSSISLSASPTPQLKLVGDVSHTLAIDEGRESSSTFRFRATEQIGPAAIQFVATDGNTAARLTTTLSVRPAAPYATTVMSQALTSSPTVVEFERRLRTELGSNRVAASFSPLVLTQGLQDYLDGFPHACAEQMVSKVFPLIGLYGAHAEVDDRDIRQKFAALIDKLRRRQLAEGGFRFWQNSPEAAAFPSVYITHFLTEAAEADLPVPQAMTRAALNALREIAASPARSENETRLRAYAIYVLTRNGVVTTNYLTDLQASLERQDDAWKKDITASYMAASYALLKLDDLAGELIAGYAWLDGNEMFSDFDSRLGRNAQHLYLLARHFPPRLRSIDASSLSALTTPIMQNRFNTLSSAYTILALQAYGAINDATRSSVKLSDADGKLFDEAAVALATLPGSTQSITVTAQHHDNQTPLFTTVTQTGFSPPPDLAKAEGLELVRRFVDANGNDAFSATLGDELVVELRIRSTGQPRSNVAVVDLLPGGFEVISDSTQRTARGIDYQEVRDDRVVTYGTFDNQLTTLRYRVKVTAAGDFTIPAVYARAMYDPTIHAHTAVGRFSVTRP
ncbi:MAG: alpha-2-macroglobulin [Pseudomonadota bacterium]